MIITAAVHWRVGPPAEVNPARRPDTVFAADMQGAGSLVSVKSMEKKHRSLSDEEIEMFYDQGFLDREIEESINPNLADPSAPTYKQLNRRRAEQANPQSAVCPRLFRACYNEDSGPQS